MGNVMQQKNKNKTITMDILCLIGKEKRMKQIPYKAPTSVHLFLSCTCMYAVYNMDKIGSLSLSLCVYLWGELLHKSSMAALIIFI